MNKTSLVWIETDPCRQVQPCTLRGPGSMYLHVWKGSLANQTSPPQCILARLSDKSKDDGDIKETNCDLTVYIALLC